MKTCQSCNQEKEEVDFPVRNDRSGRLRPYCKKCVANISKARYVHYRNTNPFLHKVTRARSRSQSLGVPFNLDVEYLESIWTGMCPVLHVPISLTSKREDEDSAELDRFVPELGYVKGNVNFLSRRANRLKNSASVKELENLVFWMKHFEDSKK